ncbi:hypothetical protein OBV_41210 [Oscillibacter valericigenes Sjm18-20]|nr:hypothetical protein OBV_41210 [Oscillibacter valericigenes Sjm18-20]
MPSRQRNKDSRSNFRHPKAFKMLWGALIRAETEVACAIAEPDFCQSRGVGKTFCAFGLETGVYPM